MTWVRFDDEYSDNPKVAAAGALGQLLHLRLIVWSSRNLSDGKVPRTTAIQIAFGCFIGVVDRPEIVDATNLIDRLIECKLLRENGSGDYAINDYLTYNPSRKEVIEKREKERQKKRRQRSSPGESPRDTRGDAT